MTEQEQVKANYDYIRDTLIRVGSQVRPKRFISFVDGSVHLPGNVYTVEEDSLSYYVVNFSSYEVVKY